MMAFAVTAPRLGASRLQLPLLVWLLVSWTATALRASTDLRDEDADIALQFDGRRFSKMPEGSMTILRQGERIYQGPPVLYNFSRDDLHKEFVVEMRSKLGSRDHALRRSQAADVPEEAASCDQVVFVEAEPLPGLCGSTPFTATNLTCSAMPASRTTASSASGLAAKFAPSLPDRGFGIEFEFVSRPVGQLHLQERFPSDVAKAFYDTPRAKTGRLRECFQAAVGATKLNVTPCSADIDCGISEYCAVKGNAIGTCQDRLTCEEIGATRCPTSLERWTWDRDSSVRAFRPEEVAALGASEDELAGFGFEVTSPAPPHVLSGELGLRSTLEMLAALRHIGVQSNPSTSLHVHVNVANSEAPGTPVSAAGIASVWVAYAYYQHVIDEMLSPGRPGNNWALRLFLRDCEMPEAASVQCERDPCNCLRRFFHQMHDHVRQTAGRGTASELCNAVLRLPGGGTTPCENQFLQQRYFQLNLAPLAKLGTIEFRAHSASTDPERVARWVQFVLAFVEYFGAGPGVAKMSQFFESPDASADYRRLVQAQKFATAAELFADLSLARGAGGNQMALSNDSAAYYEKRRWEKIDDACMAAKPRVRKATCTPEAEGFLVAKVLLQKGDEYILRVSFKKGIASGSLSVILPDSNVWVVPIGTAMFSKEMWAELPSDGKASFTEGILENSFTFRYNPEEEEQRRLVEHLEQTHRCCCDEDTKECLWYPLEHLDRAVFGNYKCPQLWPAPGGSGKWCASDDRCWFDSSCRSTTHGRGSCSITKDPSAFFAGLPRSSPLCGEQPMH